MKEADAQTPTDYEVDEPPGVGQPEGALLNCFPLFPFPLRTLKLFEKWVESQNKNENENPQKDA